MPKIRSLIFYPFQFSNMYLYFLLILTVFYIPQSIYTALTLKSQTSYLFIDLISVSILSYVIFYWLFCKLQFKKIKIKNWIDLDYFSCLMTVIYLGVILYTAMTASDIALFAAFRGESVKNLAYIREDFLRTRVGHEIWLGYAYNIMVFFVVPFILTRLFVLNHKIRYWYLFGFILTLSLTLQKGLSENAFIPLIVLAINRKNFKLMIGMCMGLVLTMGAISFLALGGVEEKETNIKNQEKKVSFLKNHILWNPYETATSWLDYKRIVLKNRNINFEAFHFLGLITGKPYYPLDNLVFQYQYHSKADYTGSANVTYFIDAYVKFGMIGIITSSCLIAFLTVFVKSLGNTPIKSVFFLSLFYMALNQLSGVLFSGGVWVLLLLILFSRESEETLQSKLITEGIPLAPTAGV